ncbi:MAG TPA: LacI family transcriptional regulator, partial [Candidatus Atribacteria bacterium]|nr:LacI family transcriptional regulator [Candidatus Atribacteria bacterium]
GVSVATVSRVLNNANNVSLKTKKKVLKVLKKYGFEIDPWARRLATKKRETNILTLISRRLQKDFDINSEGFYAIIMRGIKKASKWGSINIEMDTMETIIEKQAFKGMDGIILLGSDTKEKHIIPIQKNDIPVILIDQYIPTVKIDCVVSNGFDGASYAISHLVSHGLRNIIHIHGFLDHFSFKDRYDGYIYAMERHGLLPRTYEYDDESMEDMRPIIKRILNVQGIPDGIFTSNDAIAMKTIETLKEFGIKVPEDVSIIGFDGSNEGRRFTPSLSSLKIPMEEMGSLAIKRLLDIIYGEDIYPVKISLFTKFIKGESSI